MSFKLKDAVILSIIVILCSVSAVFTKHVDNNNRSKRTVDSQNSCENVIQFFALKNITVPRDATKGSICGGQCCDNKTETLLRKQSQRDFAALLRHNSRSLQGLLTSTAITLQKKSLDFNFDIGAVPSTSHRESISNFPYKLNNNVSAEESSLNSEKLQTEDHVSELARQSENKTLHLFATVYRNMADISREPVEELYRDIRNYISVNSTDGQQPSVTPENMVESVNNFFKELFPLAYHHAADISVTKDFTVPYKNCLKKSIESISPFGDIPKEMAQSLSKSLEATSLLLQAFRIGSEVLNTTDTLLIDEHGTGNSQCHDALVRMTYCPKCQGLTKHTKPCSGYCLNVLRGCISKYVAELDLPWTGYVEGIENLLNAIKRSNNDAGVNIDAVIKDLDTKISSAIMNYMGKVKEIDDKVRNNCGPADFSTKEDPLEASRTSTPSPTPTTGSKMRTASPRNFPPLPESELSHFLNAIAKTKGFYANLATTLCQDDSFAEQKDKQCWNGERIAEYTKTVVDVGQDMQKYNPEVKPSINMQTVDPVVATLVEKLRKVHHMAVKSLGTNYINGDVMQQDGTDGSGSGAGPDFEDDRDDENTRASGSGDGPDIDDTSSEEPRVRLNPTDTETPRVGTGGASCQRFTTLSMSLSITSSMFIVFLSSWRY